MANIIKPKRSNTANAVPTTGQLASGELAVNMADQKVYINNGTSVVQVGAGKLSGLGDVAISAPSNTQVLAYDSASSTWKNSTAGTGTVTGVTGTAPVVSSGGTAPAISLANGYGDTQNPYASKTANTFLSAPNGTAGVPSFRAIVAADIPTLNQNTTGTASNVTGTVAIANGGSGATTAAAARTNFGATTVGSNLFTLTNPSAITFLRVNADNTVSALDAATFRTAIGAGTSSTTGTVTSVGGTGTVSGLTLSGTVTTSGNLTLGGTFALPSGQVPGKMVYDTFSATASQTTFTTSATYTSGKIEVFVNGVKVRNGSDVTVTSGTSVVMASGLPAGTLVDLVYPI